MKFTTLSRRTAAAGAASALVAGALVGATAGTAQAAEVTNTYTCSQALFGEFPVVVASQSPELDGIQTVPAGFDVPPGIMSVTNKFTIPAQVRDGLANAGIENLTVGNYAGSLGATAIPVDGVAVTVSGMTDNGNGTWSTDSTTSDGDPVEGTGANGAFELPAAGTYDVVSPTSMTIFAEFNGGQVPVECSLASGQTAGVYRSLTITKNESTSVAKAPKSVAKGDRVKVNVKVTAPNQDPTGKVVLKLGTKTVDSAKVNDKGVAKLSYVAKKVGKNKLTAMYKGDSYTNKSSDKLTVKVTR